LKSKRASDPLPGDLVDALAAVRDWLTPLAGEVIFLDRTGSTNDVALGLAGEGAAEGLVVIAGEQTSGRGRQGRAWHSPAGSGLYVSIVLRPSLAPRDGARIMSLLTLAAGVALAEGVEAATALSAEIKWPNDLLIGRRKLAGILAESAAGDLPYVVLGYGINVRTSEWPPEIEQRATSLEAELGRSIERWVVCAETIAAVSRRYRDLVNGRFDAILDEWRRRSPSSRDARVAWQTPAGSVSGVTAGIDDRGALLVRAGSGVERIVGGAVTWI
jgi:BirA family transcriptional regulator, biotin operon repressor / biotin---[acetyl-CoA-carboxylase] ligase